MPFYVYECKHCGHRFERLQHMTDPPIQICPECGGEVQRVIQPVGVVFKGSGFYVTDNRGKSSTRSSTLKNSSDDGASKNGKGEKTSEPAKAESKESSSVSKDKSE